MESTVLKSSLYALSNRHPPVWLCHILDGPNQSDRWRATLNSNNTNSSEFPVRPTFWTMEEGVEPGDTGRACKLHTEGIEPTTFLLGHNSALNRTTVLPFMKREQANSHVAVVVIPTCSGLSHLIEYLCNDSDLKRATHCPGIYLSQYNLVFHWYLPVKHGAFSCWTPTGTSLFCGMLKFSVLFCHQLLCILIYFVTHF